MEINKEEFVAALIFCSYLEKTDYDVNLEHVDKNNMYYKLFRKYFPNSQIVTSTMQEKILEELVHYGIKIDKIIFEIDVDNVFPLEFTLMSKEKHYVEFNTFTQIFEIVLLMNKVHKHFFSFNKENIHFNENDLIIPIIHICIEG